MWLARYTWQTFARELTLLAVAVVVCAPLYLVVTMSLKTETDVLLNPFGFPPGFHPENYSVAWKGGFGTSIGKALFNSVVITGGTVLALIVLGSLCAYAIARRPSRLTGGLYLLFVLGLIVPFQLGIVPLYAAMLHFDLVGNYLGMILLYTGLEMPLTVFLYTGFVRALPRDYEEAAQVDGAGLLSTFFRVVFPLLRPITGTVAVLTGLIVWNDFFLQLIYVAGTPQQTLPVALYAFVGENLGIWNVVFAGVVIAIAPLLAFYLVAQRQLIRGFSGGIRG